MKIVIDISEKAYADIKSNWTMVDHLIELSDSIKNSTPLEKVFEDIKAEIQALTKTYPFINHKDDYIIEREVMEIIDRHISGKEHNDR